MEKTDTVNLANENQAIQFYDDWYSKGYMDQWPQEKKERIFELIVSLNLPPTGEILDFGCGNGEFTGVLKKALPQWTVTGGDISAVAVSNAKKRHPDCHFLLLSDLRSMNKKFDFLFSHHVLEHVDDMEKIWHDIDQYLKAQANCLHILPCGNIGSFEYNLCMLRTDGINTEKGNSFIFEDPSHLRRLTTEEMNKFAMTHGLKLVWGYYSHQFYGALEYVTSLSPTLILGMINPTKGKNIFSGLKLLLLCGILQVIKFFRLPANIIEYRKGKIANYKYYCLFVVLFIFYPLSKLTNIGLQMMAQREWKHHRNNENGSEMYLYYKRNLAA